MSERFTEIVSTQKIRDNRTGKEYNGLIDTGLLNKVNDIDYHYNRYKKEVMAFREKEEKYQRVLGGLMAYLELRLNKDLWWDLND